MSTPHLKIFLKHQPVRVWLWIFAIWAVLEAFCVWLRIGLSIEDVPLKFPISICIISPHLKNWPMLAVFCTIAWLVMKNIRQIKTAGLILFSLLLICSGNLMQGFNGAFLYPLGVETGNTDQYYAEAAGIKISSAEWLADFNENQRDLMTHSRTHPPFAVLLFRELAGAATNDGTCSRWPVLAVWLICTSLCVPMLFEIFHKIGIGINHAKYLAIFLAVMPAFNIYSVLSLDSMIFFLSLFFFHGITDINARGANLENIVAVTISTIAINLLTFGGIFFFVLLLTLAIIRLIRHEKKGYVAALLIAAVVFGAIIIYLNFYCGYDHLRAFLTACGLESHGRTAAQRVWLYIESRFEDVCEIGLCLGLVTLATMLSAKNRRLDILDFRDRRNEIAVTAIGVLFAIFLGGAYKTGETARTCMFIYPYIFLLMRGLSVRTLREIFVCCTIQTAMMQFMGSYDW